VLDGLCNAQRFLCYLNQQNGDEAPQDNEFFIYPTECKIRLF